MMEDKDKNEAAVPFLHCVLEACDGLPEFEYDKASTEPLAPLDYAVEQKVKNLALKLFWKRNGIAGTPGEIVAAELPRRYRTTSKRRVDFLRAKPVCFISDAVLRVECAVISSIRFWSRICITVCMNLFWNTCSVRRFIFSRGI
ncbi:hypothetical protein MR060_04460 [bacterium]|nr:hypothetical protein [bacterium]